MTAINSPDDLHPIGSFVIYYYPPDHESTALPSVKEHVYEIIGHEEMRLAPWSKTTEWREIVELQAVIEHPCEIRIDRKYDMPAPQYISAKAAMLYLEQRLNETIRKWSQHETQTA